MPKLKVQKSPPARGLNHCRKSERRKLEGPARLEVMGWSLGDCGRRGQAETRRAESWGRGEKGSKDLESVRFGQG